MLPAGIGLGLKPPHYESVLRGGHGIEWFEVHPENYMDAGGLPHRYLQAIAADYPLSLHGLGLSLGSADGVDRAHLRRLQNLVSRYRPAQISEHIAWSRTGGIFHHDLLPLPYCQQSLAVLCRNVDAVQTALGCRIFLENPAAYLSFADNDMAEPEFIAELQRRTGCGLLLDLNNLHVSATNNGFDAHAYLQAYPLHAVGEIHLAGHSVEQLGTEQLLIDDHGSPPPEVVWQLYADVLVRLDHPPPVLLEWDTDVPPFATLCAEAARAAQILQHRQAA
ncbi:MAG: DUF692 domain-containing protein [Cellvibrionales bacterium]|nr:DUF692 domain-containing protein [Cellvibrionales bacterium]